MQRLSEICGDSDVVGLQIFEVMKNGSTVSCQLCRQQNGGGQQYS